MMKEGSVAHPNNEYHPYANGNMQHMYNNSRQTPDSGLGNESMNNAGAGGDNSGPPAPGGARAPPGFAENPYFVGNVQQQQYNEQHQHQFRPKLYGGGPPEGGRFERSTGPPSIMTMPTSPPNMDQEGGPSYNPNYGNYPQYGNPGGGPPYGGMDRNFNAPHPMATRSHSNFSESSSSTLNMASGGGGPPDPSALSGQPLMAAGPHGGMMYQPHQQQGGPPMGGGGGGHPYGGHPQMQQQQHMQQQGGPNPYMFNPQQAAAAHAAAMQHAQMMQQGGPMGQQQGGPMQHPHGIPMQQPQQQQQQGGPPLPPGPSQSASPPQPMMMMHMGGPHGAPMHTGPVFYPQQQHAMMAHQRGPMVGQGPDGFVQFTYPNPHAAAAQQQGGGYQHMRMHHQLQQQRSMNSPAPSDITDGQSVQGGSIGVWNGPPDQQQQQSQQQTPPPSVMMQPMQQQQQPHPLQQQQMGGGQQPGGQMHPQMQPGMGFVPMQMMTASFPGATGVPPFGGPGGPRMMPGPNFPPQMHQMAMQQHMQQQGMPPMQMQAYAAAGGFPPQQQQAQTGYWQGPSQRGGYRGRGGGRWGGSSGGGGGGSRPGSRGGQHSSSHWSNKSMNSGGGGGGGRSRSGDADESSKCSTPNEDDIVGDVSGQMDSMRMDDQSMMSMDGSAQQQQGGPHCTVPHKQLLELADPKSSSSPPAEPNPSDDESDSIAVEMHDSASAPPPSASLPTTPRAEPRKELLEMKRTPKHETDKSSSQAIPVDPVPPPAAGSASSATATTAMKWSEVAAKQSCVYCKGKQRPAEEYSTHNLRDGSGAVTCPLFSQKGCSYCGAKGKSAHDEFFCKQRHTDEAAAGEHSVHPGHAGQHGAGPDAAHSTHGGEGGGANRGGGGGGGQKRGGGGGGGHYNKGRGGGGTGGQQQGGKYDNRRVQ